MQPSDLVRNTEAAARLGNAEAQYEFATMLRVGKLVNRDLVQSRAWYERSASQGYPKAQNDFASMLLNGMGGDKDGVTATVWYRRAAEAGCAMAQFALAQRYLHGDYVEVDDEQAVFWGTQAAANGHARGNTLLGNCYRFGRGVEKNLLRAAQLYVIGARGADVVGHGNLANCREEIEELALAGNDAAALITATLYAEGLGGEKNRPLAKAWLGLLSDLGAVGLNSDELAARRALDDQLDYTLDSDGRHVAEEKLQQLQRRFRACGSR
ncbi:MAG: tetratricopeptide repeat protein [Rhodanobacter sp.]